MKNEINTTPPGEGHDSAILREVLGLPTAPFHEQRVVDFVRHFARERGLRCTADSWGNLYLHHERGLASDPPIVFEAHIDHPGFVVETVDGHTARLGFLGKAPAVDLVGTPLQVYRGTDGGPWTARVTEEQRRDGFYRPLAVTAELEQGGDTEVEPGDFAVFDLPTWELEGHVLSTRAHDDLAQVASVLVTLDRLARQDEPVNAIGLLTRAEEVGFIGAYGVTEANVLPRDAVVIVLECSGLPLERGFVVRCGDLTSVYDGWATTRLLQLADEAVQADPEMIFQTPLPRRGTCNASLYTARGYRAAGLTLPMANYHNQGDGRIEPECIDLRDWHALIRFLYRIATRFGRYDDIARGVRDKVDRLWQSEKSNLRHEG